MMVAPAPRPLPLQSAPAHNTTTTAPQNAAVVPPPPTAPTPSHATPAVNSTTSGSISIPPQTVGQQLSFASNSLPQTPASTTSAFLLGMHNYEALDNIDLPEFVQEHQATLTFPEKLMLMLTYVERDCAKDTNKNPDDSCVFWILDGRAFIIRNKDELVKTLLPMFFRQAKFPSFTRKLYRWGFRQISVAPDRISSRREMIFGHEFFQRDNKPLMSRMRSVTAAGTRRAMAAMALKQQKTVGQTPDNATLDTKAPVAAPSVMLYPVVLPAPASYLPTKQQPAGTSLHPASAPPQPGCVQLVATPTQQQSVNAVVAPSTSSLAPMGAPTLQQALALSHQQRAVVLGPPNLAPPQPTVSNGTSSDAQQQQQQQQQQAVVSTVPPQLVAPVGALASFPPQPPTPVHTLVAGPSTQHQLPPGSQQPPPAAPGAPADANTYMRAAIDMLLRYAS